LRRQADRLAALFHALDGALHRAIMSDAPIDRGELIKGVRRFAALALAIADPDAT